MTIRLAPKDDHSVTIIATQERILGTCAITNVTGQDGDFSFEYDGSGTTVDWDSQETVTDTRGWRHFVGDDHNIYVENELELIDD